MLIHPDTRVGKSMFSITLQNVVLLCQKKGVKEEGDMKRRRGLGKEGGMKEGRGVGK